MQNNFKMNTKRLKTIDKRLKMTTQKKHKMPKKDLDMQNNHKTMKKRCKITQQRPSVGKIQQLVT